MLIISSVLIFAQELFMSDGFNDTRIKSSLADAEKYSNRKQSKHKAEMKLIRKAMSHLSDVVSVLDAPCGIGRATIMLDNFGYDVIGIDAGDGAIKKAEEEVEKARADCQIMKEDMRHMSFRSQSFDAILCFRFFHHLSSQQAKQQIVSELCRVSNQYVLISYLSPWSVTSIKRKIKAYLRIKVSVQNSTPLQELNRYFENCGFSLDKDLAQFVFFRSLHLAIYKKT